MASDEILEEEWLHVPHTGDPVSSETDDGLAATVTIGIHPLVSNTVLIMMPGFGGTAAGYCDKYVAMADMARKRGVGAVVRTSNHTVGYLDYALAGPQQLRAVIRRVQSEALRICGTKAPRLVLAGFSAGASAVAVVAHEFPCIERMLLTAMSGDAGREAIRAGLESYSGDVAMAVGEDDESVHRFPAMAIEWCARASRRRFALIPECDHQFRGEKNGRILSHLLLWAFLDDGEASDPTRGIELYSE